MKASDQKKKLEEKEEIKKPNIDNDSSYSSVGQNKFIIILASVFVGLVVIITTIFVLIPYLTSAKQTEIPDVKNLTTTEAIKKLQEAGFNVADETREEDSDYIDVGSVTRTSPPAGSKRKEGFEVTLYVSIGDTKITIEDYLDQNYIRVQERLETLGLQVLIEREEIPAEELENYEEGQIIRQSVEAGQKLSKGDKITLYIPKMDNKYPDFLEEGYTVDDVTDFALDMGLKFDPEENIQYVVTSEYAPGTVFYQNRKAGTTVVPGVELRIKVALASGSIDEEENDDGEILD